MSQNLNLPNNAFLSVQRVHKGGQKNLILDVRKQPARCQSGLTLERAIIYAPSMLSAFVEDIQRNMETCHQIVVFCVHGHEVSQGACLALRASGFDAYVMEGGFAAWLDACYPTRMLTDVEKAVGS